MVLYPCPSSGTGWIGASLSPAAEGKQLCQDHGALTECVCDSGGVWGFCVSYAIQMSLVRISFPCFLKLMSLSLKSR